jgi:glycosyltransferase involved in cell wall biosynthesis
MGKMRRKILFVTNYCGLFTGFGMNIRALMSYIYQNYSDKYEIALAAGGQYNYNPDFSRYPWKIFGLLPIDQHSQEKMELDKVFAQKAAYGEFTLDLIVQDYRPDIVCLQEDVWGVSYAKNMEFSKYIPTIYHTTIDSLPILDLAYELAASTKYFWAWSTFASKEMNKRSGLQHVTYQYPCIPTNNFFQLPSKKKLEIRKRFNIPEDALVFGYVFRNQPRKLVHKLIEGFKIFRDEKPDKKAFLLLHTSYREGWAINKFLEQYGVNPNEVLCSYICRATKEYYVAPYQGEGLPNPFNNNEKTLFTIDVANGLNLSQLNEVYNLMDLYFCPSSSGSTEIPSIEAALTSLPVVVPNYSYGEDIIQFNIGGSFSMPFDFYTEPNTQFLKANPRPDGIAKIMEDFCNLPSKQKEEMSAKSREWALKNYDVKVNAEKILKAIDEIPQHTWDFKINLKRKKNQDYPFPEGIVDDVDFILDLYKNILYSYEETRDTKGCMDWQASLKGGVSRQKVYEFFINVAKNDNRNLGDQQTFADLLEETGRPKLLFVLKESAGDILNSTSLLPSLKKQYPNHDVYYACDPKFAGILLANPNIHAILPYDPIMENELQMIGAGSHKGWFDIYIHAGISCQRQLNYLSHKNLGLEVK